jgi:outer membrane autotransporter protein
VNFVGGSTAGNATLINAGNVIFDFASSGGTARYVGQNGGTLDISSLTTGGTTLGSIEGAGTIALGANRLTVGGNGLSTVFSGVIADGGTGGGTGGALTKSGAGTLFLTGASTYTGPTTVAAGALVVDGSLASVVTVAPGAFLGGSGAIGGLIANGVVAPGNSIGTLTVNGSVAFAGGSIYAVEIAPDGTSDRIVATRQAILNGGQVQVSAGGPGLFSIGQRFTVLSAAQGVTGAFASVTDTIPRFTARLEYDATNVFVRLDLDPFFTGVARTPNQIAVAGALDRLVERRGRLGGVLDRLAALPDDTVRRGLDELAGDVHASAKLLGVQASEAFHRTMMREARGSLRRHGAAPLASYAPLAGDPVAAALGETEAPTLRASTWTNAVGQRETIASHFGARGLESRIAGAVAGLDAGLGEIATLGVAVGISESRMSVPGSGQNGEQNAGQVGAYVQAAHAGFLLDAGVSYSRGRIAIERLLPILGAATRSTHDGDTLTVSAALSRPFDLGAFVVEPWIGLEHTRTRIGAGVEVAYGASADAALVVPGDSYRQTLGTVGLRVSGQWTLPNARTLGLEARAAWRRALELPQLTSTHAFAGSPDLPFAVTAANGARDRALLGATARLALTDAWSLSAAYEAEIAATQTIQTVTGGFRLRF